MLERLFGLRPSDSKERAEGQGRGTGFSPFVVIAGLSLVMLEFIALPLGHAWAAAGGANLGDAKQTAVALDPDRLSRAVFKEPPIVLAQARDGAEPQRGETITERGRRRFRADGARAGAFLVFPSFAVTRRHDDNIFATSTGEVGDFVTLLTPSVRVQSDWSNHALNFSANGEVARFADRSRENYEDFFVGFDSRFDVRRSTNVFAGASFSDRHENRSSPDDVVGLEPTEFDIISSNIGGFHRFNRLSIRVEGTGDRLDFDDASTAAGVNINNDDRDRVEYRASARFGYEINPTSSAQVALIYNKVDYDDSFDDLGLNRDSDGYAVQVGAVIDLTGLISTDFLIGVFEQSFDDPTFGNIDGSTFQLGVTWDVTPLTTVTGSLSRSVQQSTLAATSGVLRSSAAVGINHELLRNLILSADFLGTRDDFRGTTREDEILDFSIGAQYLINRRVTAEVGLQAVERDSDLAAFDFDRNRIFFRLVGRL